MKNEKAKIGLFSIGLETYWGQFPGLQQRLEKYREGISNKLKENGDAIVDAGLVNTVEKASRQSLLTI
ncbi:MAG: hypothetical protein PVH88_00415 [Ignavibacteria bacterium]